MFYKIFSAGLVSLSVISVCNHPDLELPIISIGALQVPSIDKTAYRRTTYTSVLHPTDTTI